MLRLVTLISLAASGVALSLAACVLLRDPPLAAPLTKLDELTVGRLNVVEPDGTPRLIVSNRARFPGSFIRGKEVARPDRQEAAGILFVNDEGTENGGLIQSGKLDKDGQAVAGFSLTFDRFRQDQVLQLLHEEGGGRSGAGMIINDRPDHKLFSVEDELKLDAELRDKPEAQRDAAYQREQELGHIGHMRAFLGTEKGASSLALFDPEGRPRLTLSVSDKGVPALQLLDDKGAVVRTIDATTR